MKKKKIGRPRQGKTVKEVKSVRISRESLRLILQNFDGVQSFLDHAIERILKN